MENIKDLLKEQNILNECNHIFQEILIERKRQKQKWEEQNLKSGCNKKKYKLLSDYFKIVYETNVKIKQVSWADILLKEIYEALAEDDTVKIKKELIQSAAIIIAMILNL